MTPNQVEQVKLLLHFYLGQSKLPTEQTGHEITQTPLLFVSVTNVWVSADSVRKKVWLNWPR